MTSVPEVSNYTEATAPRLAIASPWRVVLIDDSRPERELLGVWLNESGRFAVVGEACDGPGGVALAAQLRPELVVLDLSMPGGDGIEALTQIVSVSSLSKVVIFSGFLPPGLAGTLQNQGASACWDKRIGPAWLVEELVRLVEDPQMHGT